MPINAQYAWEICSAAARQGKHVKLTCDDDSVFTGIVTEVEYDYLLMAGKGFAHGQTKELEILED